MADIYNTTNNTLLAGTAGDDYIVNGQYSSSDGMNVTIDANAGNDNIDNRAASVTINAGTGNDSIYNHGSSVSVNLDDGDDTLSAWLNDDYNQSSAYVTVNGGAGNDSIDNHGHHALIDGGAGNDTLYNYVGDDNGTHEGYEANYSTIRGGGDDDYIANLGHHALIEGNDGNDVILTNNRAWFDDEGDYSTLSGGAGNDSIYNNHGNSVIIDGGDGDDLISNYGEDIHDVTINGGAGNDLIYNNYGTNVTINGGTGDDRISLGDSVSGNIISYTLGDGNDTVWGYSDGTALQINSAVGWSSMVSGNNIVVTVGDGSITLVDAATSSGVNINGVTYPIDTTATTPADTSTATTPADTSTATTPADTSTATTPADTSTITPAVDTSTITPAVDTSTVTPAVDTSTVTPAVDTSTATTPADTSTATTPADTSTATVTPETLPPAVGGAAYDIVFFVDVSGSMDTYINRVNEIAQTFADKLAERGITDYRLAVVDYEAAPYVYFGADGSPFTTDINTFKSWMAQAATKSKQNLANENALYAINHALNNFPFNPVANKEFIVLTDADFSEDYSGGFGGNIFDLATTEQLMAANGVQLDVIGIRQVDAAEPNYEDKFNCEPVWTPVARSTGGNFYDINGNYEETFSEIVLNLDSVNVNLATVPDGQTGWFFLVPGNHVTDMKSVDAVFVNAADPNLVAAYTQLYGQPVGAVTADKVYSGDMSAYRQNITIPDMWNVTATSHADILNVAGTGFGVVIASGEGHDAVKLGESATGIILTDHDLSNDGLEFAKRQTLGTFTESVATDPVTLTNQVALASPTMTVYLQNFSSPLQEEFDAKNAQFMTYSVTNAGTSNTVYDLLFGTEPNPFPLIGSGEGIIMFAQWGYGFTPPEGNPLFVDPMLATSADLAADFGSPTLDDIAPANFAVTADNFTAQSFMTDFANMQAYKLSAASKPKFC